MFYLTYIVLANLNKRSSSIYDVAYCKFYGMMVDSLTLFLIHDITYVHRLNLSERICFETTLHMQSVQISFFLEHAGELRFNILRRMGGAPKTKLLQDLEGL